MVRLIRYCLLATVIMATGCSAPKPSALWRPATSSSPVRRMAVLPFENVSDTLDVGRKITSIFLASLYNTPGIRIVEEGEVEKFLMANRIRRTGEITMENAEKICSSLNVDAVLLGTVAEYGFVNGPGGKVPVVNISIRIVNRDCEIIFAITHVREGDDSETIFGIGRITSAIRLSKIVIDDIIIEVAKFIKFYNLSASANKQAGNPDRTRKPVKPHKPVKPPRKPVKPIVNKPGPTGKVPDGEVKTGQTLTEEEKKRRKEEADEEARKAWIDILKKYKSGETKK